MGGLRSVKVPQRGLWDPSPFLLLASWPGPEQSSTMDTHPHCALAQASFRAMGLLAMDHRNLSPSQLCAAVVGG